jgi:hypothetical protein
MEDTLESHLRRIQQRLADGRNVLRSLRQDELRVYDIPDVVLDRTFTDSLPPQDTDKYTHSFFPPHHRLTSCPLQILLSNRRARAEEHAIPRRARGDPRLGPHDHRGSQSIRMVDRPDGRLGDG